MSFFPKQYSVINGSITLYFICNSNLKVTGEFADYLKVVGCRQIYINANLYKELKHLCVCVFESLRLEPEFSSQDPHVEGRATSASAD